MSYEELAYIVELEEQVKQQAAVIEQKNTALSELYEYADRFSVSGVYLNEEIEGQRLLAKASYALVLQPCPEVLNKVRADAINKEASALWHAAMEKCKKGMVNPAERNDLFFGISHLRESAQRIEQGEA